MSFIKTASVLFHCLLSLVSFHAHENIDTTQQGESSFFCGRHKKFLISFQFFVVVLPARLLLLLRGKKNYQRGWSFWQQFILCSEDRILI
jgi:hypothetical protein